MSKKDLVVRSDRERSEPYRCVFAKCKDHEKNLIFVSKYYCFFLKISIQNLTMFFQKRKLLLLNSSLQKFKSILLFETKDLQLTRISTSRPTILNNRRAIFDTEDLISNKMNHQNWHFSSILIINIEHLKACPNEP